MNLADPKTAWRLTLAVSACLVIGLLGYSTFAIVRAMRSGDQSQGQAGASAGQAPAAATPEAAKTAAEPEPAPEPASARTFDTPQNIPQTLDALRQREQGRQEMIDNLRQQARENPDDPGTLSKERIDALEKSGDSLM